MSENLEHNERIAKWLNKELSPEEEAQIREDEKLEDLEMVISDIDTWRLPPVDIEKGLSKIKESVQQKETKVIQFDFKPFIRYAAAVIIIAVGYFSLREVLTNPIVTVETGIGQQLSYEMPDGSIVTLGPVSKIEYRKKNWNDNRSMTLVGQGFFDVETGPGFSVETNLGVVSVLGTEFDIKTQGDQLNVNCYEGRVRVDMDEQQEFLSISQGLTFSNDFVNRISLSANQPKWLSGLSTFENSNLKEVVGELKRYFAIELDLPNKYAFTTFTGSFAHKDLNSALRSVFSPLEILYTLSEDGKVVFQ